MKYHELQSAIYDQWSLDDAKRLSFGDDVKRLIDRLSPEDKVIAVEACAAMLEEDGASESSLYVAEVNRYLLVELLFETEAP